MASKENDISMEITQNQSQLNQIISQLPVLKWEGIIQIKEIEAKNRKLKQQLGGF